MATAKVKDFEACISSGRSERKQDVSQPISTKKQRSATCQSALGARPLLPPKPIKAKHVDFSKSPVTVCSSSARQASLPCSSMQSRSPSAKSELSLIAAPALKTTTLPSPITKSSKEKVQKPQTPPKPPVSALEFTKEKGINNLHGI